MRKPAWRDRLRYAFDNSMARGPIALIGWLAVVSLIVMAVAAAIIHFGGITQEGGDQLGFFEAFWESLVRTLDSGTFGSDTGWTFRLVMFGVTICGVFFVSALIGIINNGLEDRIEQLRKGRSQVLEQHHTLILGWSPKIFTIISELVIANENQSKPRVVILADKDIIEMQDEVTANVGSTRNTKVIYRNGSPLALADLEIVNPHAARAIIVLAPEHDDPDAEVIKTILALTNHPNRRAEPYHIVAELSDPKNLEIARLVGKDEAQLIVTSDLISRIIVQTARQSGLSEVYTELLDFGGDEIYFQEEPTLVGRTFGETLFAYEDCAVIGVFDAASGARLNPPMDAPIKAGDKLIAIAEDDDKIKRSGLISDWANLAQQLNLNLAAIHTGAPTAPRPERTLILGWNNRGTKIVSELDNYVTDGSQVSIVADVPDLQVALKLEADQLRHLTVTTREADTTDRRVLDSLGLETYQQVIILCYSETLDQQAADARTLMTLLHLRDITEKGNAHFRIVSEMLDVRNRELAAVTHADDFIVSNKLTSLILSQISENKELEAVLTDLFDPEGSEVYLKPAQDYAELGASINFYTIVEAARRRNEVAIGYCQTVAGVVVNPDKSQPVTFAPGDRIIVLAES